jgi:hypothetical protein
LGPAGEPSDSWRPCHTHRIVGIGLLLFIALVSWLIVASIWRRRQSIVGRRGWGIRADVGRLHDVPRVRVQEVSVMGPEQVRLVLASARPDGADGGPAAAAETEYFVAVDADEPAFAILRGWQASQQELGAVVPTDSRIIRLRSLDDLQPLTLRRLDP